MDGMDWLAQVVKADVAKRGYVGKGEGVRPQRQYNGCTHALLCTCWYV